MFEFKIVEDWIRNEISEKKISGACVAVMKEGMPIFRGFYGYADIDRQIPVNEDSVFRLASMTKPVTAVAVMLCVQDGLLDTEMPIDELLPEFAQMWLSEKSGERLSRGLKAKNKILLRHLLCHSSGLGCGESGDIQYKKFKPQGDLDLASAVHGYSQTFLEFEPGSAQAYSPVFALDVAARMVEIVSRKNYAEFVSERIFRPLGMDHTSYNLSDYKDGQCVLTYTSRDGKLSAKPTEHNFDEFPSGYTGGGAGLISSLDDYCKFSTELLFALRGKGRILSKESADEIRRPRFDTSIPGIFDFFNWGYGVRVVGAKNDIQALTPGSFGWSGAYGTHFWVDPVRGITAVYMHNSDTYGGAGAPHTQALERLVMQAIG